MMSYWCYFWFKLFVWVLGKGLLLAMYAEIQIQLCVDPDAVCIGWEGNCKEELMNGWIRKIDRELNLWELLYELLVIAAQCIFCV